MIRSFHRYQHFWNSNFILWNSNIFDLVTLTLKFDLLLKNFNLCNSFLTRRGRAFIFHMYISCYKTFPQVPTILTYWPWPWSLTYFYKNFNLGHSFLTRWGRAFIFHRYIPYDKTFPSVPEFLTCWPWPWSFTYFKKTLTLAIDYWPEEVELSYFICAFFAARPSMRYHDFLPSGLTDLDLVGWPTKKIVRLWLLNQRGYLLLLFTYGCRRRAMLSSLTTPVKEILSTFSRSFRYIFSKYENQFRGSHIIFGVKNV